MLKNYTLIFFLICGSNSVFGQSIMGILIDSLEMPLQYSPVALIYAKDSSICKGVITNDMGSYNFSQLQPAKYLVKVDLPGYGLVYSNILACDSMSQIEVPPMILYFDGVSLKEIGVSAIRKTVEFKNGNITVNIENSALATGNTAYDLLMRLPGVALDQVNNSISIQGREGVKVLIDGRTQQLSDKQLLTLLKSISAASIEKIDILKNPPIEYDASGTAGIINIITKKVKLYGFSGNVNTSASQGFYANGESGFSLNYMAKRFAIFSSANSEYGRYININNFNRRITANGIVTNLDTKHSEINLDRGLVANLGADWYINSKSILGLKILVDPGNDYSGIKGNARFSDLNTGYDQLLYQKSAPGKWHYYNYNLNAERLLDTIGGKLKLSLDYSPNTEEVRSELSSRYFNGDTETHSPIVFYTTNKEKNLLVTAKTDLDKKLRRDFELKSGLKYSKQQLVRDYQINNRDAGAGNYSNDTALSNTFNYDERIMSGYFQLDKEIGDFSVGVGLRGEHTLIDGGSPAKGFNIGRKYFNLFPLAAFEFEPNDKHNFQLSYNQRINRPEPYVYIPYKSFPVNILLTELGNPNLKPEYSNTIEFTHTFKGSLSNAVAYSRLNNYLMEYTLQNDSTKEISGYLTNIKSSTTIGYTFFFEKELRSWWRVTCNLMANYSAFSGKVNERDYSSSGFGYSGMLTNIFLLKHNLKLEVEGNYIGPNPIGIFTIQPRWAINFALKKSFLKNKLDVAIGANDLFYTLVGKNKVDFESQKWTISETHDSRRIKLSVSYNFGRTRVEERETSSNAEERERLKH